MARMWRIAAGLLVAGATLSREPAWAESPPAAAVVDPMDSFHEMRLECLVLADPAIGETRLSLRKTGDTLEVRGTCESVAARRAALAVLAREHKGALRDLTSIAVIPFQPRKPMQSAALQKMAARRVKEIAPSQAAAIQVESAEPGMLEVSGLALSMEDKVEISRALKKLAGVVAVRNDLRVSPMMREGRMVTLVTADGRRAIDGSMASSRPARPEAAASPAVAKPVANQPIQPVVASDRNDIIERKADAPKPRDAQPPAVETARIVVAEAVSRPRQPNGPSQLWQPPPTVTVGGKPFSHPADSLDIQPAGYAAAHAPAAGESKTIAWRNKTLGVSVETATAKAKPSFPASISSQVAAATGTPNKPAPTRALSLPELMPPPSIPTSAPAPPIPEKAKLLPNNPAPKATPSQALSLPELMPPPSIPTSAPAPPSPEKAKLLPNNPAPKATPTQALSLPELMPPPSIPTSAPAPPIPEKAKLLPNNPAPKATPTQALSLPELMPPPSIPTSAPSLPIPEKTTQLPTNPAPKPPVWDPVPTPAVRGPESIGNRAVSSAPAIREWQPRGSESRVEPAKHETNPVKVNPEPAGKLAKSGPPSTETQPIRPVSARMVEEPVSGRMIEEEPLAVPTAPAFPKISIRSSADLKKAVEKACGRAARKVTVTQSGNLYHVAISVRGSLDEKAAIDRMMSIPEALSPQVRFEVRQGD